MLSGALPLLLLLSPPETGHERMIVLLRELAARALEEHAYLEERTARGLRRELEELEAGAPPAVVLRLRYRLGEAELKLGRVEEAIRHLEAAKDLLDTASGGELEPGWNNRIRFRLGVAYLALYQARWCREPSSAERCIWPIRRGVGDDVTASAVRYLTEVLDASPRPSPAQFAARWLLNIAHMAHGDYPNGVPRKWLLPLPPSGEFPRFEERASEAGVDVLSLSGGVVADDLDEDGDADLLVSVYPLSEQLRWFRNAGGLSFEDRTAGAGLTGITGGLNMVQGDYDNDGDLDVLVLRGAWAEDKGRHPSSLLRNNGDGTFTDVTFEVGLGDVHYPTQTAAWADYDNDGDLDLYIGNETSPRLVAPSQLFRNDGARFTDVAEASGVTNLAFTKAVVWGDYDGDGDPDLYVSNLRGPNRLYRNRGNSRFVDVAGSLGVTGPEASFPAWFWDFDNDGDLDLYVSAYVATVAHLAAASAGVKLPMELARLYRNDGHGGFEDVAGPMGLARPSAPMGANFGDLDGDGFLDLYLGTGYPNFAELMPNVLYRNVEGRSFEDVTIPGGFGSLAKGHGVAFADLDGDGDNDLFEQMGGGLRGDLARNVLFENPGFGARYLRLRLVGVRSNRAALGARIRIVVSEEGDERSITRHVSSGGSFGANPLAETIGLGQASRIERLEVEWPTSGFRQSFTGIPLDRDVVIVEGREPIILLP